MNYLLLLFVVSLPDELQVPRESFSLKGESLMSFSLRGNKYKLLKEVL